MENFLQKSQNIHGNIYNYSKINYKNNSTKVVIICSIHGEFKQTPAAHFISKIPCPLCYKTHKEKIIYENSIYHKNNFLVKANLKHANKYDYSKVEYINNSKKIIIICN